MSRLDTCCGNAECDRCTPMAESPERAALLTRLRRTHDVDDLVTFALAGDGDVRVEAVRQLARLARGDNAA